MRVGIVYGSVSSSIYLMSCSDLSEIGHVGYGTHRESFMNQTIVDKHVRHPKHCNSKTLFSIQSQFVKW